MRTLEARHVRILATAMSDLEATDACLARVEERYAQLVADGDRARAYEAAITLDVWAEDRDAEAAHLTALVGAGGWTITRHASGRSTVAVSVGYCDSTHKGETL